MSLKAPALLNARLNSRPTGVGEIRRNRGFSPSSRGYARKGADVKSDYQKRYSSWQCLELHRVQTALSLPYDAVRTGVLFGRIRPTGLDAGR